MAAIIEALSEKELYMKNTKMYDTQNVLNQYKDGKNLSTRISIYDKYKVGGNDMGWMYQEYDFFDGCEIAEFGSGTGKDWENRMGEASKKYHITLSDFSPGMVGGLKEKYGHYKNVDVMQIDIQDIPFSDGSKDFAIANAMLYHVPDIDKAISEVHRILKPGGVFYAASQGSKSVYTYLKGTINDALPEVSLPNEVTFTMQNGTKHLEKYFADVRAVCTSGKLEITDTRDLVDFIYSMSSIEGLRLGGRQTLMDFYDKKKNADGKIIIELEYGMFAAKK